MSYAMPMLTRCLGVSLHSPDQMPTWPNWKVPPWPIDQSYQSPLVNCLLPSPGVLLLVEISSWSCHTAPHSHPPSRKLRRELFLSLGQCFGSLCCHMESSEISHWFCLESFKKIKANSLSFWISIVLRLWLQWHLSHQTIAKLVYRSRGSLAPIPCVLSEDPATPQRFETVSSFKRFWSKNRSRNHTVHWTSTRIPCCAAWYKHLPFLHTSTLAAVSAHTCFDLSAPFPVLNHQIPHLNTRSTVSVFCLLYPWCCFRLLC